MNVSAAEIDRTNTMDSQLTEQMDEPVAETPEDVAILYSWANLHGAKYRDFSASRREYRAQVRHRAAEDLRESELNAQAQAEAAASEAERVAREAERAVRSSERFDSSVDRGQALRDAEAASRRASAERVEAARRAESAALAEAAARREEREIAEAHSSAQRQAARWNDSEIRQRSLSGPQPRSTPALAGDPYEHAQGSGPEVEYSSPNRALDYTQPQRFRDDSRVEQRIQRQPEPESRRPRGFRPDQTSGVRPAYRPPAADSAIRSRINPSGGLSSEAPRLGQSASSQPYQSPSQQTRPSLQQEYYPAVPNPREDRAWQQSPEQSAPAWLYASNPGLNGAGNQAQQTSRPPQSAPLFPPSDSLQHSRERVASRWFALKGVFEAGQEPSTEPAPRQKEVRTPYLAVFSLAGGVGKTSLVATLGRTLSSLGEKVLLADTTSHGLLPYYFGATELKPGVIRTFSPPSGSTDAAIHLVSYEVDGRANDRNAQDLLAQEIANHAGSTQRLLLDLNAGSGWLMRRLLRMAPTVLVPVAPDMNSVISLQTVERYFNGAVDGDGRPLLPYYILNQFDVSLPLHLDVREVLRRQLGERLLPYVIRRSPSVSEALAEGMTVLDYSPEGPVAEDYCNLANWLRSVSAPAMQTFQTARWSER